MARIKPFAGVHYAKSRAENDVSALIAPPFDVLDERSKGALQAKSPHNVVTVDLPYLPPKAVGPDEVYEKANITLQSWLKGGVLVRDTRPAMYPYTQSFDYGGRTYHRRGFVALVRLSAFGEGEVVPHEKTYREAIEDRLKLMRATRMQLSPIFGLFSDPRGDVTNLLYGKLARPELSGTLDGIRHDLWHVIDAEVEDQVVRLMRERPVYIADGHHRYTTALEYKRELEEKNGGPLPETHPANWVMFVLVSMQNPGLLILPTHRLIGGLENFDVGALRSAVGENIEITDAPLGGEQVAEYTRSVLPKQPAHTLGLYDGRTKRLYQMRIKNLDVLKPLEPKQSDAWRELDYAIVQRYLLEEVIGPKFAGSGGLTRGYTASPDEVGPMTDGSKYQVALLLQSAPLAALEQLGKQNELMPQKSTYFYPKLATGMMFNALW